MAKNSITDYDNTAANNADVQSVDISEGCSPSGINNAIREVMADLADVNDGTVALTSPQAANMTVTGTVTTDAIAENTSGSGVTIDGVLLKDGGVGSATAAITAYLSSLNGGQLGGNRNLIINGAMAVYQRGSQAGIRNSYGVDRFKMEGSGSQLFTYSQSTTVPSGEGFSYSIKLDVTTADTSVAAGDYQLLRYIFEGQDLQHLKYGTSDAQSITLQFWVRSPKTGTHIVELEHTDAGYFNSQSYTIATADTWQKVTLTFDGYQAMAITNDNTDGFKVSWWLMSGSTFSGGTLSSNTWHNTSANRAVGQVNVVDSTSNDFYITGVQLEVGEQATPFEHRSFGDDLRRCQRYYWKGELSAGPTYLNTGGNIPLGNGFMLPVTMRAIPTGTVVSNEHSQNTDTDTGLSELSVDGGRYKCNMSTATGVVSRTDICSMDAEL